MFIITANKNRLTVRQTEVLTSGSVNVNEVQFAFSQDWEGLERTAVFRCGEASTSVLLDESGRCFIPWEALRVSGFPLLAGVYGRKEGEIVLPTMWVSLGRIHQGVELGEDAHPPTPDLWEQLLASKANRMAYTPDGELGLYAGYKLLSSVPLPTGGGGTGGDYFLGPRLKVKGGVFKVDTAVYFEGGNTQPITAAAVQETVGNIELLLGTI